MINHVPPDEGHRGGGKEEAEIAGGINGEAQCAQLQAVGTGSKIHFIQGCDSECDS